MFGVYRKIRHSEDLETPSIAQNLRFYVYEIYTDHTFYDVRQVLDRAIALTDAYSDEERAQLQVVRDRFGPSEEEVVSSLIPGPNIRSVSVSGSDGDLISEQSNPHFNQTLLVDSSTPMTLPSDVYITGFLLPSASIVLPDSHYVAGEDYSACFQGSVCDDAGSSDESSSRRRRSTASADQMMIYPRIPVTEATVSLPPSTDRDYHMHRLGNNHSSNLLPLLLSDSGHVRDRRDTYGMADDEIFVVGVCYRYPVNEIRRIINLTFSTAD